MKKFKTLIFFLIFASLTFGESPSKEPMPFKETIKKEIGFGDKLTLKVKNLDEKNLRDQLKEFYIEDFKIGDMKTNPQEITVTFRGLSSGTKTIILGDRKIEIEVKSNLKDDEREIYLNLSDLSNRKLYLPDFPYVFSGAVVLFILALYLILKREPKEIVITSEERFKNRMDSISIDDENWSFDLSYALREYIDSVCLSNFLSGIYIPVEVIDDEDVEFIQSLDLIKFSNTPSHFQFKESGSEDPDFKGPLSLKLDSEKQIPSGEIDFQNKSKIRDKAMEKAWEIACKLKKEVESDV